MTNQTPNSQPKAGQPLAENTKIFDLEERTACFGENTIKLCKRINQDHIDKVIVNQLIRSATSVGANYMEANGSNSKRDFRNKIAIVKKEAKETTHWLRMLATALPSYKDELRLLWKEAHELALIFSAISNKTDV